MTTFREVYDRGEMSYMFATFRENGWIIDFYCERYDIPYYANDALDSDSFASVSHTSNYSKNNKYEYYATIEQIAERLGEILRKSMSNSQIGFQYNLNAIRTTLKTIYKSKKKINNTPC